MSAVDIENALVAALRVHGWTITKSISAHPKRIPFLMIETIAIEQLHAQALFSTHSVSAMVVGPEISPDDKDAESVTHNNLLKKLGKNIVDIGGVLKDRWTIFSCEERPPEVSDVNGTPYWTSGYELKIR